MLILSALPAEPFGLSEPAADSSGVTEVTAEQETNTLVQETFGSRRENGYCGK